MNQDIENEREWRRHLMSEVSDIKKNQQELLVTVTSLKVKIGAISVIFGALGSFIHSLVGPK